MALNTAMTPIGVSQTVSISGTNASANISAQVTTRLVASTDCFVTFGAAATVAAGMFLPAGVPEYFEPKASTTVQAITSAATGSLYITQLS